MIKSQIFSQVQIGRESFHARLEEGPTKTIAHAQ